MQSGAGELHGSYPLRTAGTTTEASALHWTALLSTKSTLSTLLLNSSASESATLVAVALALAGVALSVTAVSTLVAAGWVGASVGVTGLCTVL